MEIQSSESEIDIPLKTDLAVEQKNIIDFLSLLRGSGQINDVPMQIADTYFISEVNKEYSPKIKKFFPEY
jgi:hypothetical protein